MTERPLLCETRDAVRIVTINDPPWNRMTLAFMDELEHLVAETAQDDSIRSVVMTGSGEQNFSVGMNLKEPACRGAEARAFPALWDGRMPLT